MPPVKKLLIRLLTLLFFTGAFSFLWAGDSISVYIFLSETCPICQNQTLTLRQLYSAYAQKGIAFTGLFPNAEFSTPETISKFGKKYKLDFDLKADEGQKLVNQFSATTTPQVFVVRNSTQEILYHGKVDNSFEGIGKKRQVITAFYLRDALDSILQGKSIAVKQTPAVGCYIIKS
ncbi:MAG: redoxin domain-containing protein [Chitinophagales bacterium]|nr:redoxin domain-containing protein [Chitinophagales bacterium]